jgi:FkbM family methyltransferase
LRDSKVKNTGRLYPKTKNYYQKVFVRKIFGKKLYKHFKVFKIVLLYKIGKSFEITDFLKKVIKKDSIIFDIGANLGQYAIRLTQYISNGRVVSVEPVYDDYTYLLKLKKRYNLDNFECFNYAISDYEGEGMLYIPVIDNDIELDTRATIDKESYYFDYMNYKTQKVNVTTVNNLFEILKLSRLDIIKSDTEGNDKKVLTGSIDLIKKYLPMILVEDSHKEKWLNDIYCIGYLPFYVKKKIFLKDAYKIIDNEKEIKFDLLVLIHKSKLSDYKKYII